MFHDLRRFFFSVFFLFFFLYVCLSLSSFPRFSSSSFFTRIRILSLHTSLLFPLPFIISPRISCLPSASPKRCIFLSYQLSFLSFTLVIVFGAFFTLVHFPVSSTPPPLPPPLTTLRLTNTSTANTFFSPQFPLTHGMSLADIHFICNIPFGKVIIKKRATRGCHFMSANIAGSRGGFINNEPETRILVAIVRVIVLLR